jgi:hypothetical protein
LSATPSATRPSEGVSCQQRVRLKAVEVPDIYAYVRAIFDASRRKLAFFSSGIPWRGWKACDFAQLKSSQARVRLVFHIIDLRVFHAVVGVAIGVGKGIPRTDPFATRARGQLSQDWDDHSLRLFEDLLNRWQAKIPLKRLVAVATTQNERVHSLDADLPRSMRSGVQSWCERDVHN